jgi:hypothetical protein
LGRAASQNWNIADTPESSYTHYDEISLRQVRACERIGLKILEFPIPESSTIGVPDFIDILHREFAQISRRDAKRTAESAKKSSTRI